MKYRFLTNKENDKIPVNCFIYVAKVTGEDTVLPLNKTTVGIVNIGESPNDLTTTKSVNFVEKEFNNIIEFNNKQIIELLKECELFGDKIKR